jgi:hypothetical protein
MEPSFNEIQLLRELRKEEKDWRRNRWLQLLASLIPIAGSVFALWNFYWLAPLAESILGQKSLETGFYLCLGASAALILDCFGALGLIHVARNWSGNRTRQLLIEMAERQPRTKRSAESLHKDF